MGMSLEDVAELLTEAEIQFEASEDGGILRAIFTTDPEEFVDLDGNPSLAMFFMADEKAVTIHTEALLDVSKARFRGPLGQAVLEFTSNYNFVRARYLQDPLSLILSMEYLLEDGALTPAQLKSAVEHLLDCSIIAKPFLQAAMDTGKVDTSLILPPEEG